MPVPHKFVIPFCAVALLAGCAQQKPHATVPVYATPAATLAELERPMNTAPDTDAGPPLEVELAPPMLPDSLTAQPAVTLPVRTARPTPPRPPVQPQPSEANANPATRPVAPQLSPQISVDDQAGSERKTNDDLAVAEKNLQGAGGRQLNAAQQDLVDKIRSFVAESRDAGRDGDWTRAQNLSQKARVLSIELLSSF